MLFWILVAALVAGVTLFVTRPLMQSPKSGTGVRDADIAVYKDQLKEVSSEAARGALAPDEAESAKIEIARRLLRASQDQAAQSAETSAEPAARQRFAKTAYVITSIALPAASLALYLAYGAPGLPGQPLSDRIADVIEADKPNDLVAKVEARLRDHPEDGMGWDVIAPVYYAMGRYADAAEAYANASRLIGESPGRLQGFADARIRSEDGIVPEDARKALERTLVISPQLKEPRIWLALAKEQDGRLAEAAADYRKLIAEAPADAPWRKVIEERLAGLMPSAVGAAAAPPAVVPSSPDASAVLAMGPEERQAFIARMVDGLAARLKADGTDAAGWVKLIRAYQVLGRRNDAVKALSDARTGLKGDQVGLARVEDVARELGLGS